jgi:hypothetical protein
MPIPLTSRLSDRAPYEAGQTQYLNSRQGDSAPNTDTVLLPFGVGVTHGANGGVTLPVDATSKFAGITKLTDAIAPTTVPTLPAVPVTGYPVGYRVDYVSDGEIVVVTDQAVTRGAPAFWRHTTGGTGTGSKGTFRLDADTARAIAIPAEFVEDAAAGLAILRVNKP